MPELFEKNEGQSPQENPQGQPEGRSERETGRELTGDARNREDVSARHTGRDVRGNELVRRPVTKTQRRVVALTWMAMFFMMIYVLFIGLAFWTPGYSFIDRVAGWGLVLGEVFIFLHGMGYANSMIKASNAYDEVKRRVFSPQREPKVVCLIACFNEPLSVLEETTAAMTNLDYGNKEVVILDDSTKEEVRQGVRDIGLKYGATVRQRTNRRGYKAGAINDFLRTTDAPYIAIFDADGLPAHNLLRDLMPIIEENPRLAFVQTPQFYANTDVSNVALAASRQQAVFYEYICEGKSHSRSAFCCGTNVVFRRDALLAVGGFDESSVTEDFVTSLGLHLKGYDSTYYNQVYAYSMAPETLPAYFTQQGRWAYGSIGGLRKVLKAMFTRPGALSMGQWWEYFLSSTYYWIGWVNFIFMVLPMTYIFFNVKPLRSDVYTYLGLFVPYMIFTMNMFYSGMEQRGYKLGDMLLGQQIGFISFPVHMKSAISSVFGLKRPFAVTPKGEDGRMSWLSLWPQLLMFGLSLFAGVWGMYRYFAGYERQDGAMFINAIWSLYYVVLLSGLFRLNKGLKSNVPHRYFADDQGRVHVGDDAQAHNAGGVAVAEGAAVGGVQNRIFRRPIATPLRPSRPSTGRLALVLGLFSLLAVGSVAFTMIHWATLPINPVNVYVVDRTAGRDYQQHRSLTWTLNFLKVRKEGDFHPEGATAGRTKYDWASDFYGFVPGNPEEARAMDNQADLQVGGVNRPLPARLETPGALYLADTYGEFVEFDYGRQKYVHYISEPRGLKPDDVDRIKDFYDRKGLVIGEWNTIGYPTMPGDAAQYAEEQATFKQSVASVQKYINILKTKELPARQAQLKQARAVKNATWEATMQKQIAETQAKIAEQNSDLAALQGRTGERADFAEQSAAHQQLEQVLHVNYQGWYGRYVDKFEQEAEFDWRLFKNVNSYDRAKFPNGPKGPGFVFYKDGPSRIKNPETGLDEPNPFSEPIVITQNELRRGPINMVSGIYTSQKPGIINDRLLQGVARVTPVHYWFEMVQPASGTTVLAYYKLNVTDEAIARLRNGGFPATYFKTGTDGPQIVFPAVIAYREGKDLRSIYIAGDASSYSLVSRITEMAPSTGGVASFIGGRYGSFSQQYYWNFYEPLMKNVLETPGIRYNEKAAATTASSAAHGKPAG